MIFISEEVLGEGKGTLISAQSHQKKVCDLTHTSSNQQEKLGCEAACSPTLESCCCSTGKWREDLGGNGTVHNPPCGVSTMASSVLHLAGLEAEFLISATVLHLFFICYCCVSPSPPLLAGSRTGQFNLLFLFFFLVAGDLFFFFLQN